jgi:regulator of cell morphogenesis and NO signaling
MISSETTVREVALQMPESTRLFEKLKIDYCCGGNQPLADACASAGVNVDNVMEMLEDLTNSNSPNTENPQFKNAPLPELIEHILNTHHVFTKTEMDRIEELTRKVINAHGANHPELIKLGDLFAQLCAELHPHMFKEEQVLFPYIVNMAQAADHNQAGPMAPFGTVNNPVRMMLREHDTAGQMLRDLRALTSDYAVPQDACISYQTLYQALENFERDLHQHIHLENNLLFPRAIELENDLHSTRNKLL